MCWGTGDWEVKYYPRSTIKQEIPNFLHTLDDIIGSCTAQCTERVKKSAKTQNDENFETSVKIRNKIRGTFNRLYEPFIGPTCTKNAHFDLQRKVFSINKNSMFTEMAQNRPILAKIADF